MFAFIEVFPPNFSNEMGLHKTDTQTKTHAGLSLNPGL
jgi:hypothetical protein